MRIAVSFAIMLMVLPSVAFASSLGTAMVTLYVPNAPFVSVSLAPSGGTFICSWDITDADMNDTFHADVVWSKNGKLNATESVDCGAMKHCAALYRPLSQGDDEWKCSVVVHDSYNATGSGSAQFTPTPLSFLNSLLRGLLNFFGLA